MRRLGYFVLAVIAFTPAAFAQEDESALYDKLNRLERDVNFLQKQVYRGGSSAGDDGITTTTSGGAGNGQIEVRLTQIDQEIRQIRGQLEQAQFQTRQTAVDMKKLSDDTDYRLRALEQKQAAVDAAAAATPAATAATTTAPATDDAATAPANYQPGAKDTKEKPALTGKDFPDANAEYSAAFKLLNEKKYPEAASALDTFVKKYPGDPLTSNAYYWLGESYYARADYTRAAESFRKGFETNPDGQKAPDNLLKLAMSLAQVKRTTAACVVLGEIITKYSNSAARTVAKAIEQRNVLQCK